MSHSGQEHEFAVAMTDHVHTPVWRSVQETAELAQELGGTRFRAADTSGISRQPRAASGSSAWVNGMADVAWITRQTIEESPGRLCELPTPVSNRQVETGRDSTGDRAVWDWAMSTDDEVELSKRNQLRGTLHADTFLTGLLTFRHMKGRTQFQASRKWSDGFR